MSSACAHNDATAAEEYNRNQSWDRGRGGEASSAGTDGESMKIGQPFSIPAYVPPEKVAAEEVDPDTVRRLRAQVNSKVRLGNPVPITPWMAFLPALDAVEAAKNVAGIFDELAEGPSGMLKALDSGGASVKQTAEGSATDTGGIHLLGALHTLQISGPIGSAAGIDGPSDSGADKIHKVADGLPEFLHQIPELPKPGSTVIHAFKFICAVSALGKPGPRALLPVIAPLAQIITDVWETGKPVADFLSLAAEQGDGTPLTLGGSTSAAKPALLCWVVAERDRIYFVP